jgi:predicted DNA-binding protein
MKTAISVPDELFERVTKWTSVLGVGRSAFFQRAAEAYVERLEAESFTREYDEALARVGEDATFRDVLEYNKRRLAEDAEDW